jgi:hypothetical protein
LPGAKIIILGVSFLALVATAQKEQTSDAKYITGALSAAPTAIANGAAVVRFEGDGSMRTLREGNNGFTCMIMGTDKMCNDANSMEFIHALMRHVPPPDKVGISYMLAGDEGASNTDPYPTGRTHQSLGRNGSAPDGLWPSQQDAGLHQGKRSGRR